MEDITAEIDDVNKEIIVSVPRAIILSHEIDEDSIETLDEKNGLFNPIKIEDIREFDVVTKENMEQRAIEIAVEVLPRLPQRFLLVIIVEMVKKRFERECNIKCVSCR